MVDKVNNLAIKPFLETNLLSPYSTGNWVRVGYQTQMKSTPKNRNVHGQRQHFALGPNATYIPLAGVGGWRRVKRNFSVSRRVKREKCASPNARNTNMLVFFALGNAKVPSFALADAKVPDARYFAFWWNIGLRVIIQGSCCIIAMNNLS